MKRDTLLSIRSATNPLLAELRREIADTTCERTFNELGTRIWLLPEFYYSLRVASTRPGELAFRICEGCAKSPLGRPTLIRADQSENTQSYPTPVSNRSWPIGRGLASQTILDDLGLDDAGKPIRHVTKPSVPVPSRYRYMFDPEHPMRVNGLRYRHAKYLSQRYGAVMLHQLVAREIPFGCVAVHVPAEQELGDDKAMGEVLAVLKSKAADIELEVILAGYELPKV